MTSRRCSPGTTAAGTALPMIEDHDIEPRLAAGWAPDDPLLPVATGILARQAGYTQLWASWMPQLRGPLQDAVNRVGVGRRFTRNAAEIPASDGSGMLPWTLPLHRSEAVALVGVVRTAAIVLLAAVSGMRASELMELRVGCRRGRGTGPRAAAVSARQQNRQRPAAGRHRRRVGRHRTRLPGGGTRRAAARRPAARRTAASAGSPSTSATNGSGTGSTPRLAAGSDWPRSPRGS